MNCIRLEKQQSGKVRLLCSVFGRWVIIKDDDANLAWTGARWMPHSDGVPLSAQICNFYDQQDAAAYARFEGFEVADEERAA